MAVALRGVPDATTRRRLFVCAVVCAVVGVLGVGQYARAEAVAYFEVDAAALVAHRYVASTEVNHVWLLDQTGAMLQDLSDDLFGVAAWPAPADLALGALETDVFRADIDSAYIDNLTGNRFGLSACFTDTDDSMFALDHLAMRVVDGETTLFEWVYGWPTANPNDGYGLGLADGQDLPEALPDALPAGSTGTGFDETVASKTVHIVPEPSTVLLLGLGLIVVPRLRLRRWGLVAVLFAGLTAGTAMGDVAPGSDLFITIDGATHQDFSDDPIPADFFGPGSDPFDGIVLFEGEPFAIPGPSGTVWVDTIVERFDAAVLPSYDPPSEATIGTQMVALSLRSVAPITVWFNGGVDQSDYHVRVCLSGVDAQPGGTMTLRHNLERGGRFDSVTPVITRMVFTKVSGVEGAVEAVLDPAPRLDFTVTNRCWSHEDPSGTFELTIGGEADQDCDGFTKECSGGPWDGQGCVADGDCYVCVGGANDGMACAEDTDCRVCIGGSNPGDVCLDDSMCFGGGVCDPAASCNKDGVCLAEAPFPPSTPGPDGFYIGVCWSEEVASSCCPPKPPRVCLTPEELQKAKHGILPGFEGAAAGPDSDGDLFPDALDNCPLIANSCQNDWDEDCIGDACEPDQLHLIGDPTPSMILAGTAASIVATVEGKFSPVGEVDVVFTKIGGTGDIDFTNGEACLEDDQVRIPTDGNGKATVAFITTAVGPVLIEVQVCETGLVAYYFLHVTPPGNDTCLQAAPAFDGANFGGNVGSVVDDPDPSCTSAGSGDVWWTYTTTTSGSLLLDTCGAYLSGEIDTVLAVYDACGGAELACDNDCLSGEGDPPAACLDEDQTGGGETVDACVCLSSVDAGRTLWIQVQGYDGDAGPIVLSITPLGCPPPKSHAPREMVSPAARGDLVRDTEIPATSTTEKQPASGVVVGDQRDTEPRDR